MLGLYWEYSLNPMYISNVGFMEQYTTLGIKVSDITHYCFFQNHIQQWVIGILNYIIGISINQSGDMLLINNYIIGTL